MIKREKDSYLYEDIFVKTLQYKSAPRSEPRTPLPLPLLVPFVLPALHRQIGLPQSRVSSSGRSLTNRSTFVGIISSYFHPSIPNFAFCWDLLKFLNMRMIMAQNKLF
ncbi:hypothetical protein MUK42_12257 [Musa troglodytarum]|uniref:Uncharacterized protein n=1 Tax=Musa troglodytarum TaxID=320322 RepID=A0A9E7HEC0_9LILI|nr:hypothetical protein MUK42_12257 [Musa troglodytarum]